MRAVLAIAFLCATLAWMALVAATPWLSVHSAPDRPEFLLAGVVYRTGAVVCHQRADRSFHISGAQLPVCARCTGLYAGAALGALAVLAAARRLRASSTVQLLRRALVVSAAPTFLIWTGEWLGAIHPSSLTRAAWAVPLGAAVSAIIAVTLLSPEVDDRVPVSGVN